MKIWFRFWTLDPCFIHFITLVFSCHVSEGLFRITNWIAESSDFSLWFWHLWSWSRTIFPNWHEELHDCLAFWCCSSAKSFSWIVHTFLSHQQKGGLMFEGWLCTAMIRWTEKSHRLGWKLVGAVQLPSIALHFFALKAVGLLSVRWQRMHSVCSIVFFFWIHTCQCTAIAIYYWCNWYVRCLTYLFRGDFGWLGGVWYSGGLCLLLGC